MQEVLEKMRQWTLSEIKRAEKPYADPFTLTSLSFCASKVAKESEANQALAVLRTTMKSAEMSTYDVVTPAEALVVIGLALAGQS